MSKSRIIPAIVILISLISGSCLGFNGSQSKEPLTIASDTAHIDQNKGYGQFDGAVNIKQGATRCVGERLVVYFDKKKKIKKAVISGNPAKSWSSPGKGQSEIYSTAKTITYYPQAHDVILQGNARSEQNGNVLKGPTLKYNTESQVLATPASRKGRTTILLQPQKKRGN